MTSVVSTVPKSRFDLYQVKFPTDWEVSFLDAPYSDEALIEKCKGVDFLFIGSTHAISSKVVENIPSIRLLHVEGVGYDKVDVEAASKVGLPVCNNQGVNAVSVAEFTVGMMLTALRRMVPADREIKAGRFEQCQKDYRGQGVNEMCSRKVGLIGCGAIGRNVVRMLQPFQCEVVYYDEYRLSAEQEQELHLKYLPLDELLSYCDIISLHIPVLPKTINMISKPQLQSMKPNAIIVNASRGEVLDQYALAEALESGRIAGAAIDTLSPEPPGGDHPLINLSQTAQDRLLLTPHVAGTTNEAFIEMLKRAIANMQRAVAGEALKTVVNKIPLARAPKQ
jgi:phosphoglycerate dehydrogenase-like enzyme